MVDSVRVGVGVEVRIAVEGWCACPVVCLPQRGEVVQKMTQNHREQQLSLSISGRVLLCGGLLTAGCGIVVSNVLFNAIPPWIADPGLILLVGLTVEILIVTLIDYYWEPRNP